MPREWMMRWSVALPLMAVMGCARIDAPALRPIGDAKNWQLVEPMVYRVAETSDSVVVPAGFVTDFASIPHALQSFISPMGPYLLPAIVHDYLYWEQVCSRPQADSLFLKAMVEMEVPERTRMAMYRGVARFGGSAWEQNREDREEDLPRIVPDSVRRSEPLESWAAYREYLRRIGVSPGEQAPISQGFCAHGGPRGQEGSLN